MAQQDTGLGWSAEDNWLITAAGAVLGTIRTIGGSAFTGQPLGEAATINDMPTASISMENISNGAYYTQIASDPGNGGQLLVFYYLNGTDKTWVIVSDSAQFTYHLCQYVPNSTEPYSNFDTTDVTNPLYDSTSGLYYWTISTQSPIVENAVPGPPEFTSFREGMEAISVITTDFTKDNVGYAVAAIARWKTNSQTIISTPVLISSESSLTDMTETSGGYNIAKLNILHLGMRFYMSFFDVVGNIQIQSNLPVFDYTASENPPLTLENVFKFIASAAYAHITVHTAPDPYEEEGEASEEEGGDGEDLEDDEHGIEVGSDFPSAIDTGFCRIFTPSESELRALSNYLWSNSYDLTQVKKLFANPMDSVIGLSAVPLRLLGSSVSFTLGGVPVTGLTMPMVTKQRYTVQMGYVDVEERWGSYLDYDPYTKFSIFLPFIGMRTLSADDIMGKRVTLFYDIDILSGACCARLQAGKNCLYEWGGTCSLQLPINSRNWDSVFSTAVSSVGGILGAVTGGSAPLIAGSVASAATSAVTMKPHIDKSGNVGGASSWLGQMRPYLIRTTPEAYIPGEQNKFIGYPAYINVDLAAVKGYNEVDSVHLENVTATGAELDEIESILKGGVIF